VPRPLLELADLDELELDELELDEPGAPGVPGVPELVLPDFGKLALEDALLAEPGSARATAPAASTLATPTVAVVVVTRPLARWRAATARATASRFGVFMT
jgi:hypothetical protein